MKVPSSSLLLLLLLPASAASAAFSPSPPPAFVRSGTTTSTTATALGVGSDPNVYTGGNPWKPDSEKMGSTDTGDYFPEGYDPDQAPEFAEGMMGSQPSGGDRGGPALPGMENLGEGAVMMGGIEEATDIPEGMRFVPKPFPDGEINVQVASNSKGEVVTIDVGSPCMTFEDFYASFSEGSHPSFSVSPNTGRLDRRGGETTEFTVTCEPRGKAGTFTADLVINMPEDNSCICYKITANSF